MKRLFSLLLTLALTFVLVGCGTKTTAKPAEKTTEKPTQATTTEAQTKVYSYEEYIALKDGTQNVTIESYIQAKTSVWEKINLYLVDNNGGAYYVYDLPIDQTKYDEFAIGKKIRVTGTKTSWSGEVELIDATYEFLEGTYIAEAQDLTQKFSDVNELLKKQNVFAKFEGLTVTASKDAEGNDVAWLYKWNGSGEEGDDLYFNVTLGETTYSFLVESYLCDKDSDVYKAVKALTVGAKVNIEGFLYWYNNPQMHVTKVTVIPA